jgi:hypothetical protein
MARGRYLAWRLPFPINQRKRSMHYDTYLTILTVTFTAFQTARIFSYFPTILLLLKPGASAKSYSLLTWGTWVGANSTQSLLIYEQTQSLTNPIVLTNAFNTLMNLVVMALIVWVRAKEAQDDSDSLGRPSQLAA